MADPIRLYLDEDAQRTSLVRALRARQIDLLTANEAGKIGISDAEQLAFAVSHRRTVFTFNLVTSSGYIPNTSSGGNITGVSLSQIS